MRGNKFLRVRISLEWLYRYYCSTYIMSNLFWGLHIMIGLIITHFYFQEFLFKIIFQAQALLSGAMRRE